MSYTVLAPQAGGNYSTRSGTRYTADATGVITGVALGDIHDLTNMGAVVLPNANTDGDGWNAQKGAPQVLAATGATQGNAAAVTANRVRVTTTTSSEGVILKTVGTGAQTQLQIPGTHGVKVYPPSNCTIDALSTNTGLVVAAGKAAIFIQRDATHFDSFKSA